jgi:ABC-type sugar transport system ATPase subunit
MAGLSLHSVKKRFGQTDVITGVDLDVRDGEFVVFVGPSGCGKSTLLRMIAGLERTTEGRIEIGGKDVTNLDPAKRGIAMVFQTYALYPHMTVAANMGFPLEMAGMSQPEIDGKVVEAARILHLEPYSDASRASFPAASASASPLAAPSSASRASFCSTNRYPISTPNCAYRCGSRSPGCTRN